jgi:hypothetical protein
VHWNTRSSHEKSNAPWDVTEHTKEEEDVARLTFFKADGKLWRSTEAKSSIRQIDEAVYAQVKDRGDNFPDDNGAVPSTDLLTDGWTWEMVKAAYGEDEALLVGGPTGSLTEQQVEDAAFRGAQRAEDV